jgi:hypothetical protein
MWEVDDPVLLADRGDRVPHRHAPRDLVLEEEPDHLPGIALHLLAGDDDEWAVPRELDCLLRAREDVVVRDGDRSETLGLRVVEERLDGDGAVVRVLGVHMEVAEDERAVGEGIAARGRAAAAQNGAVDALERVSERRHALARSRSPRLLGQRRAPGGVLGEARHRGGDELGLRLRAGRIEERHPCRLRLERDAREPALGGYEGSGVGQRAGARARIEPRAHVDAAAQRERNVRAPRQRSRAQQDELPARQVAQRAQGDARTDELVGPPLEHEPSRGVTVGAPLRLDAVG